MHCRLSADQTGQVSDVLHRSGNVYDSNGAQAFILHCIERIRKVLPGIIVEVRMDSAFFSDDIVSALDQSRIKYTISFPFERFPALKERIAQRSRWYQLDALCDYFETRWKSKCWSRRHRFILARQKAKIQHHKPLQLDLFTPHEYGFAFKAVLTNKRPGAAKAVVLHNGRGSQEGIFGELESRNHMDYVPSRTWCDNQVYLLLALFAHNLTRELQMITRASVCPTQRKRTASVVGV